MNTLTKAAQDVLAERARQVTKHGGSDHDDTHDDGALAAAASHYAYQAALYPAAVSCPKVWPWDDWTRKYADSQRDALVRAAALLLAEIERLDRAADAAGVEVSK